MARVIFSRIGASFLLLTLSACVMPVQIGGFAISGVVLDDDSGLPIAGVHVNAYFAKTSFYSSSDDILIGDTLTDQSGRFEFDVERATLIGGTGGWSGRINRMPSIRFEKEGYCRMWLISGESSSRSKKERIAALQEIVFRLRNSSTNDACAAHGTE